MRYGHRPTANGGDLRIQFAVAQISETDPDVIQGDAPGQGDGGGGEDAPLLLEGSQCGEGEAVFLQDIDQFSRDDPAKAGVRLDPNQEIAVLLAEGTLPSGSLSGDDLPSSSPPGSGR